MATFETPSIVKSFFFSPTPSVENCDSPLLNAALRERRSVVDRHAGREDDQLDRAALANRQLGDPARIDDLAELGGRAIDRRRDRPSPSPRR